MRPVEETGRDGQIGAGDEAEGDARPGTNLPAGTDRIAAHRVRSLLEDGYDRGYYTAAAAIAGDATTTLVEETIGQPSPASRGELSMDTPFDVASLTKPIVTTTILFRLLERGLVTVTDELGDFIPTLEQQQQGEIPIWRLVTHTSGLKSYAFSADWNTAQDVLTSLPGQQLFDRPIGDGFEYSCLNYVYLAEVLRRVTGKTLASLATEHVFTPAEMDGSALGPYEDPDIDVVATYDHEFGRGELTNEIHDPIANTMGGESGNAGLFAPARDVARYAQAVLGDRNGRTRLLSGPSIDRLSTRRVECDDLAHGYGWRLATDHVPSPLWSARSIGHTGFTGTSLWIDLERERFACLLTNAVYTQTQLYRFRQRFHSVVAAAMDG